MKILVDADACPAKNQIISIAKKYNLEVILYADTSHILSDDYARVITVDKGNDAVDLRLVNDLSPKDIVISQDYGVATMALSKKAFALNPNGKEYTDFNIDQLLFERYLNKESRRLGKKTRHPKKRTPKDNENLISKLKEIIQNNIT